MQCGIKASVTDFDYFGFTVTFGKSKSGAFFNSDLLLTVNAEKGCFVNACPYCIASRGDNGATVGISLTNRCNGDVFRGGNKNGASCGKIIRR